MTISTPLTLTLTFSVSNLYCCTNKPLHAHGVLMPDYSCRPEFPLLYFSPHPQHGDGFLASASVCPTFREQVRIQLGGKPESDASPQSHTTGAWGIDSRFNSKNEGNDTEFRSVVERRQRDSRVLRSKIFADRSRGRQINCNTKAP